MYNTCTICILLYTRLASRESRVDNIWGYGRNIESTHISARENQPYISGIYLIFEHHHSHNHQHRTKVQADSNPWTQDR